MTFSLVSNGNSAVKSIVNLNVALLCPAVEGEYRATS